MRLCGFIFCWGCFVLFFIRPDLYHPDQCFNALISEFSNSSRWTSFPSFSSIEMQSSRSIFIKKSGLKLRPALSVPWINLSYHQVRPSTLLWSQNLFSTKVNLFGGVFLHILVKTGNNIIPVPTSPKLNFR